MSEDAKPQKELKLVDLNNEHLHRIYQYLSVNELCTVSKVCKRLKYTTEEYFSSKYKELNFKTLKGDNRWLKMKCVKQVLCCFGRLIESMEVSGRLFLVVWEDGNELLRKLLKHIAKYCARTLKTLKIKSFYFLKNVFAALRRMPLLESLTLKNCFFKTIRDWNVDSVVFGRLKELIVDNVANLMVHLNSCYPLLEKIRLTRMKLDEEEEDTFDIFIMNNSQLKVLVIDFCSGFSSVIFTVIAKFLKNLHELKFNQGVSVHHPATPYQENILSLAELKQLKVLELHCDSGSIAALLNRMNANGIAIDHLHLSFGLMDDETVNAIANMKSLKVLKLNQMTDLMNEHLIELAKKSLHLSDFHVKADKSITNHGIQEVLRHAKLLSCLRIQLPMFRLNSNLYAEVLDFRKLRPEKIVQLEMTIYADETQVLAPQNVIDANETFIKVIELQQDKIGIFNESYLDDSSDDDGDDDEDSDSDKDDDNDEEQGENDILSNWIALRAALT